MALNIGSYKECIKLRAEDVYCDTEGEQGSRKAFGVITTTRNIGTSPSLIILRAVWAELIIFIGIWLGASFIIFQVEVKGRTSEYK